MSNNQAYLEAKERLRRRLVNTIADVQDRIADIEWWNANRPDEQPFDVGGDRVQLKLLLEMLALVDADKKIPIAMAGRLVHQSLAICEL